MTLKLGKLSPKANPRTLLFSKYVKDDALPAPPSKAFYEYKVGGDWGLLGNDQYGDCTCAGPAHEVMMRTSNTGVLVTPTVDDVLAMYGAICPGFDPGTDANDNGAAITDALAYMQSVGLAGHRIQAWAQIDQANLDNVKRAIYIFGSINVGVQLPRSAMDQFGMGNSWEVVPDDGGILGGHCIPIMGYGSTGCTCITWGKRQSMSWDWFVRYVDESYVELAADWLTSSGEAPNHLDIAMLQDDLNALKV